MKIVHHHDTHDEIDLPQVNDQKVIKTKLDLASVYLKSMLELENLLAKGLDSDDSQASSEFESDKI